MDQDPDRNPREQEQPRNRQGQPPGDRQFQQTQDSTQGQQPPGQSPPQFQAEQSGQQPYQPQGQSQRQPHSPSQQQLQGQSQQPQSQYQPSQSAPQQQSPPTQQTQQPKHSARPQPQQSAPPQQSMQSRSQQAPQPETQQAMPPQQGMQRGQRQLPIQPVGTEDILETDAVTASRDESLVDIVEKMAQRDVGTVIVTEDDRPVGIITDRKIALTLGEEQDPSNVRADDVMTEDPVTVTQETNTYDIVRTLGDNGIRRVPVVDDEGTLRGIVSIDDLIVLLAAEMDQLSEVIERQIERF